MISYNFNTTLGELSSAPCISLPLTAPTSEAVRALKRQPTACVLAMQGQTPVGVLNAHTLVHSVSEDSLCIRATTLEQLISERFIAYPSSTRVLDLIAEQDLDTVDNIIIVSPTGTLRSLCTVRLSTLIQLKQTSLSNILGATLPPQQSISASESCLSALEKLSHENVHFLTVTEDGKTIGAVTRSAISNAIRQQKNVWDMTVRSVTETLLPVFRPTDQAYAVLAKIELSRLALYALDAGVMVVITRQQLENALDHHIKQLLPTPPKTTSGAHCDDSATITASCYSLDQPLKTGILGFTTSLTIHSFNQAALELLDATALDIEHTNIQTITGRLPALADLEERVRTLNKDTLPEIRLQSQADGSHSHLKLSLSGVWDGNDLRGYILTMQDTTEMVLAETRLRKLAYFDSLTGLPNRLLFAEKLSGEISRCARTGEVFALLFADLDHFKTVNDTHGHHVGDEVLRHFSNIVSKNLRECDTVGRLAGDEFTIILPGVKTEKDVSIVIDKIQNSLRTPLSIAEIHINLECSIGFAFFPHDGTNAEALIAHADKEMYREKQRKR